MHSLTPCAFARNEAGALGRIAQKSFYDKKVRPFGAHIGRVLARVCEFVSDRKAGYPHTAHVLSRAHLHRSGDGNHDASYIKTERRTPMKTKLIAIASITLALAVAALGGPASAQDNNGL